MIVTDRFAFVHMHKTGGQTVNGIIEQCIPRHRVIGYHYPVTELPEDAAELPVVGIVRNPWDWYVSWYAFNRRPGMRNPLFEVVSDGGTKSLATTIRNLAELGSNRPQSETHRARLEAMLPDTLTGNRGAGLTRRSIEDLAASDSGYLSWLFGRMLGDTRRESLRIGRFENLAGDFVSIMAALGVPETGAIRSAFADRERANVSRHSHYSHYYDDELRDVIGNLDRELVEAFGYRFESRKPGGATYAFPADAYAEEPQGFRKLLDREKNFLRLNERLDVTALREKVGRIPAAQWAESDRNRIFNVHRYTQSLPLVHFEDFKYETPEVKDLYAGFRDDVQPVIDYIADYYSNGGFVVRALLAKLAAGGEIPKHTDAGYSLMNCHRVHLPLITNDEVDFFVGGETLRMGEGELWEINNATTHGVRNEGTEDRVHLIIDWMPNHRGEPVASVLKADGLEGEERAAAPQKALASMIGQALELQRSGQLDKAESLYRQALHFDADHVIANNLLGLLCLKTRRFDDAVQHIGHALTIAPDDAQAHANLGLALKECGRIEDAVHHLEQSLRLAPDNPRVLTNLGGLLLLTGRANEAVDCFRKALETGTGQPEFHFNLGSALLQAGRFQEAAATLERCLALRPNFAEARNRLDKAQSLIRSGTTH